MPEQKPGVVRISPSVLATLVRLTAAAVPGVAGVGSGSHRLLQWLPWRRGRGVRVEELPDGLRVELKLVVQQGTNMLEVASRVQLAVGQAIEKTVGQPVREVNVRVEDVQ